MNASNDEFFLYSTAKSHDSNGTFWVLICSKCNKQSSQMRLRNVPFDCKFVTEVINDKFEIEVYRGFSLSRTVSLRRFGGFQHWKHRKAYTRAGFIYRVWLCHECCKQIQKVEKTKFTWRTITKQVKDLYYQCRYRLFKGGV